MQTYEILVRNRSVVPNSKDMTLVRTSVGIDQVHVLFDNQEWLAFPITITFAQGDALVTQALPVTQTDSDSWVAEATMTVPHEVVQMTGAIRVTLQGTDKDGNHIITAKGSPLSVEEAGDVVYGEPPEDAPTVDEYHQAYAQAIEAATAARSAAALLESQAEALLQDLLDTVIAQIPEIEVPIATDTVAGKVKVGDGLGVTNDGTLSVTAVGSGLTPQQVSLLSNIQLLAQYAFDTRFVSGVLQDDVRVKRSTLPLIGIEGIGAAKVDNDTITADVDGTIRARQYVLPVASTDTLGGVMIDGVTILSDSGTISVPYAQVGILGLVKPDGTSISISEDGTISATGGGEGGYTLPKATSNQLGGIIVGDGLSIEDGVLSVSLPSAEDEEF